MSPQAALIAEQLTAQTLLALLNHEIDAIRIKNYYSPELCERFIALLSKSELYGYYANVENFGRVGQAYYEGEKSPEIRQRYFDNAVDWIRQMRSMSAPHLSPTDRIRLELDEVWPAGAMLGILDDRKMFTGIARFAEGKLSMKPHQDNLSWHVPDDSSGKEIIGQIGANLYLKMPTGGGELNIWRLGLDKADYFDSLIRDNIGIDPSKIPPPDATMTPEEGELILMNTRRLHSVTENKGGKRITWSCFIGFKGNDKPLMIWA